MVHTWTKITKPTGNTWTKIPKPSDEIITTGGVPIGLLMALTYANTSTAVKGWTKIPKASGTAWTKIIKAT